MGNNFCMSILRNIDFFLAFARRNNCLLAMMDSWGGTGRFEIVLRSGTRRGKATTAYKALGAALTVRSEELRQQADFNEP